MYICVYSNNVLNVRIPFSQFTKVFIPNFLLCTLISFQNEQRKKVGLWFLLSWVNVWPLSVSPCLSTLNKHFDL